MDCSEGRVIEAFYKDKCPKCPQAKMLADRLKQEGFLVKEYVLKDNYFDICADEVSLATECLAEQQFHGIKATPTILVVDDHDRELAEWRGVVPSYEEITKEYQA
jgi:hypothetical protein